MFKPFPRNQLATKAQSFPRNSSNTVSPMIASHARDFTWNRGCSSNSPPLTLGDQIPHPLEDSDNQIPSSPGRQRCQMPGVCLGGMLKLQFDRYIRHPYLFILATSLQQPPDKSQMIRITKTALPDITHDHQLVLAIQCKSPFATVLYLFIIFFKIIIIIDYCSSDFIDLSGHMLNFKPFEKCFFISKR